LQYYCGNGYLDQMKPLWYHDLYRVGSVRGVEAVVLRVILAVGIPLVGGVALHHPGAAVAGGATALFVTLSDIGNNRTVRLGTMLAGWVGIVAGGALGHELGGTPYADEMVVLLSALVAGWASGSHPGIAAVTRYFAVAAAAATGMRFTDPEVLTSVAIGGFTAFAAALLTWRWLRLDPGDNTMDWRAGVRRAFVGAGAGARYTICYALAAAIALFAASWLGVTDPFWATLVVLMVMRREGTVSLELTIHYAVGTVAGVLVAAAILHFAQASMALAICATLVAAFARTGFAINPALGFMSFTMFLLFIVHVAGVSVAPGGAAQAVPSDLISARVYDVAVGCVIALAGTLAAIYPRTASVARARSTS
jgi:hypothetical protein